MVDKAKKGDTAGKAEGDNPLLRLSDAPHLKSGESIRSIMWCVVLALMPATVYSVYLFGFNTLLLLGVAVVSAMASEALFQLLLKKPVSVLDGSAVITGLLVAMNVPPMAPWWMVMIGSAFAIIIAKQLFGGLGFNIFNPALAARAFLMASWPVHMTTGWFKFGGVTVLSGDVPNISSLSPRVMDIVTQATPLTLMKEGPKLLADNPDAIRELNDIFLSPGMLKSLIIGNVGGCIGETSALLLLLGAIFLLYKRIITWHIPVTYIATVGIAAYTYYAINGIAPGAMAIRHVVSGGLFLGAFFMATDMVTSPVSAKGMILFGIGCGLLTFIIRVWGGYPEGVSYSILLMNAVVPLIDRFTRPRVFGRGKKA